MVVRNVSGEAHYFTFVPRGYLLENYVRGRSLEPGETATLPDNDSQIATRIQQYVDQGLMTIEEVGPPTPPPGEVSNVVQISAENKDVVNIWIGAPIAGDPSGTGYILASASDIGTAAIGMSIVDAAPGFATNIQTNGWVYSPDWTAVIGRFSLQILQYYFLDLVAGKLVVTPPTTPGTISQQIGFSISPTTLCLAIQPPILN